MKRKRGQKLNHIKRGQRTAATVNVFMFIGAFGKGHVYCAEKNELFDFNGKKKRAPRKGEKKGFNCQSYYDLLNERVIQDVQTKIKEYFGGHMPIVYQHDNASVHTGKVEGRDYEKAELLLNSHNISLLSWPACR